MRRFAPRTGIRTAVVLGPLFLDVVFSSFDELPLPGEELWCEDCTFVAGGAANQARALHRMGFDASLCSYLGQDLPGRMVQTLLVDDGISPALLRPIARQAVTAAMSVRSDRAMVSSGTDEAPPLHGPAPDLLMCDLRSLRRNEETVARWRERGTFCVGRLRVGRHQPVEGRGSAPATPRGSFRSQRGRGTQLHRHGFR